MERNPESLAALKSIQHCRNTQIEISFEFVCTLLDDLAAALDSASLRRHVCDPVRPRRKSVKLVLNQLHVQFPGFFLTCCGDRQCPCDLVGGIQKREWLASRQVFLIDRHVEVLAN